MIAGAIFDLDGTILDSMPIWENAAEMFLNRIGVAAEPGLSKTMFAMTLAEGAEYLREKYNLDMDAAAIQAGIVETITDFYARQVRLKEGAVQCLAAFKQAGIKITAATSSARELVEKALARLEALGYFSRIFTCTEVGAGKDKPDIFLAAAEYMGTPPERTWVFEDALHAIETAKRAGFRAVGVFDYSSKDHWQRIKEVSDVWLCRLDADVLQKIACAGALRRREKE
ncbi:MAG: HAD family phosphatase [Firmicutes bacterium]|nr:HAD family phosphatase [Bacillota bacterium]HOB34374.1 HAD family phosphatase [Bacillota bacterium]HPZ90843.1 HAD family phosphatase [Bacillota bacterium]HQE02550.1 HAD family phosphatase [Bacillota bacterium]